MSDVTTTRKPYLHVGVREGAERIALNARHFPMLPKGVLLVPYSKAGHG